MTEPTTRERDEVAIALLPLARRIAGVYTRRVPLAVEFDDLYGETSLAAVEIAVRYRPERGDLVAYARRRMSGAAVDYLRSLDPLTRDARARVRAGTAPECVLVCLDALEPATVELLAGSVPPTALADVLRAERLVLARGAVARLAGAESDVCLLIYRDGLTMKECGARLGVSESRVSQIHKAAVERMRAGLAGVRKGAD